MVVGNVCPFFIQGDIDFSSIFKRGEKVWVKYKTLWIYYIINLLQMVKFSILEGCMNAY
jgi:hypothetical protein